MRWWTALILSALLHEPTVTLAATISSFPSEDGTSSVAVLAGDIVPGDAGRLEQQIEQERMAGRPIHLLRLSSRGGQLQASAEVALVVRRHNLTTVVPANQGCASGCFLIFAAGVRKIVESGGLVGVHAAAEAGRETEVSRNVTRLVADVLRSLSVPDVVLRKMLETPHNRVTWLCPDELRAMGAQLSPVRPTPGCSLRR